MWDPMLGIQSGAVLSVQGRKYMVELDFAIFETDVPAQHMWDPHGKNYKVLWHRTLKEVVE